MSLISSASNARSVLLRTWPAEPTWSRAATPASSLGKSAMQTTSYSPTVHSSSRTRPPEFSTSLEKSSARWVVSRKFLMPSSVQLIRETYVFMLCHLRHLLRVGVIPSQAEQHPGRDSLIRPAQRVVSHFGHPPASAAGSARCVGSSPRASAEGNALRVCRRPRAPAPSASLLGCRVAAGRQSEVAGTSQQA